MQFGFIIYSFYTVVGKIASKYDFLSINSILFYVIMVFILFFYAIIWQQVLKIFPLSFASINKSVTIIWGMIWGKLFFNEQITFNKLIGVILIIIGICILAFNKQKTGENND